MNRLHSFFFVLSFLLPLHVAAPDTEFSLPTDTKQTWNIGVTKLLGTEVSEEYHYLESSIPRIVLETISRCENHRFKKEEKAAYQLKLIENNIQKLKKQLSNLLESKDKEFFNFEKNRAERERLDLRITQIREELAFLEDAFSDEIKIEEEKPVIVVQKNEMSQLLDYPLVSPRETGERKNIDLLIYGFLEEIEGYLFIEVRAWNSSFETDVFKYTGGFSVEEVQNNAEIIGQKLLSVVLGHDWAELTVRTKPETGEIYIEDQFYGQGVVRNLLLTPGTYTVFVERQGYETVERSVTLQPEEKKSIDISLSSIVTQKVRLESTPSGADVYIGSVWQGKTPLTVIRPTEKRELILKKEQYRYEMSYLHSQTDSILSFTLSPDLFDWEKYLEKKRNSFYLSLGVFALSVPVPIILFSVTEDLAAGFEIAYAERDVDQMRIIHNRANITYHSYLGGLFIATTLLVNTFIQLIDLLSTSTQR